MTELHGRRRRSVQSIPPASTGATKLWRARPRTSRSTRRSSSTRSAGSRSISSSGLVVVDPLGRLAMADRRDREAPPTAFAGAMDEAEPRCATSAPSGRQSGWSACEIELRVRSHHIDVALTGHSGPPDRTAVTGVRVRLRPLGSRLRPADPVGLVAHWPRRRGQLRHRPSALGPAVGGPDRARTRSCRTSPRRSTSPEKGRWSGCSGRGWPCTADGVVGVKLREGPLGAQRPDHAVRRRRHRRPAHSR